MRLNSESGQVLVGGAGGGWWGAGGLGVRGWGLTVFCFEPGYKLSMTSAVCRDLILIERENKE